MSNYYKYCIILSMKIEKDLLFYFYAIGYTRSALAKQSGKKLAELS